MGMFEKDKLFGGARLDVEFGDEQPFVLFDAGIIAENVDLGNDLPPATKSGLVVGRLANGDSNGDIDGEPFVVGTLASAIADKVRAKSDGDLPCVVKTQTVPTDLNDAKVLTYVGPYNGKAPKNLPAIETV